MYNSMSALPSLPYNIVQYLAKNNEIIWKLLKYNSYDALSKPDLTFDEKMDLIWKDGPQEEYSVFLTNLIEDAIPKAKTIVKIYDFFIHAEGLYTGNVVYAFDCLYGGQMSLVEYNGIPVNRGDLFINQILKTLNGVSIGGAGKLMFDENLSRYCSAKSVVGNSKTFAGACVYLSTRVGDTGETYGCDK